MKTITEYLINNHIKSTPVIDVNKYKSITYIGCDKALLNYMESEKTDMIEKFILDTYHVNDVNLSVMKKFINDYYNMYLTLDFNDPEMKDLQNRLQTGDKSLENILKKVSDNPCNVEWVVCNTWPDLFNGFMLKIIEMEK